MNPATFIAEKTDTGFSAYAEDFDKYPVGTTGRTITELKANLLEAINLLQEHANKKLFSADGIVIKLDLAQSFNYYKVINAAALSKGSE